MGKYNPPECPFCGRYILQPKITKTVFGDIYSGRCNCGAVYVCDPTGHNVGEAYMEALALAKGDWDISTMNEGVSYQTLDMDYDIRTHKRVETKGLMPSGKLIFVNLLPINKENALSQKESNRLENIDSVRKSGKKEMKAIIKGLLETGDFEEIKRLSIQEKGVIRWLISLTYDKLDVISWRAIEAMGVVSKEISKRNPEIIRETIRKLLWSMGEESGGIGWSAAEMIGEIIRENPEMYGDIIPILWSFKEEEMFRPGVIRAMYRIGEVRQDLIAFILNDLQDMLIDKSPAVRGYAALIIGILRDRNYIEGLKVLLRDNNKMLFFQDGAIVEKKVSDIAKDSIEAIN